jgi:hypothetical protein
MRARLRGDRVEAPGSAYRGGRVGCLIKVKNPAAAAVTREARRSGIANPWNVMSADRWAKRSGEHGIAERTRPGGLDR